MLQSVFMGIGLAMDASCVSMTNGLVEKSMRVVKIIIIALIFGIFQSLMPILGYFIGSYFSQYIDKFIPLIALIVLTILGGKMIIETLRETKHSNKTSNQSHSKYCEVQTEVSTTDSSDVQNTEIKAYDSMLSDAEQQAFTQQVQESVIEQSESLETVEKNEATESAQVEQTLEQDIRKIKVKEIIVQAIATSIDAFSVGVLFVTEKKSFAMISFVLFGIITALMCIGATFIGKKFGAVFKEKAGIIGGVILILIGLKIFIEYMVQTY